MVRIAVCDDEKEMLECLYELIREEFKAHSIETAAKKFSEASDLLKAHSETPFDAIFLDIKMPEIDGFAAAARIRKLSENTYIIFITTESALVYDSFEFQPFNFIPKDSKNLERKIKSVVSALTARLSASRVITLKLPYSEEFSFKASELICLKSVGNYTEYSVLGKEPVRVRQKLDSALEEIDSELFLRSHKSFAVNMSYIQKISFPKLLIYLTNGEEIPISKPNRSAVEEQYSRFLRNSGGAR